MILTNRKKRQLEKKDITNRDLASLSHRKGTQNSASNVTVDLCVSTVYVV